MSRVIAIVPSLGLGPDLDAMLAALRAELAAAEGGLVWVHQGRLAPPPALAAPRERLLAIDEPSGFARAANLGVAAAEGAERIALVNDDATLEPGWLDALARTLDAHPDAVAAQGVNLLADGSGRADGWGLDWNRWRQAIQLGHGERPPAPGAPPFEVFGVSATAALFRAPALVALGRPGPFDERLGSYYEDADLALRLRARDGRALAVPAARARHVGSATAGRRPARRWRQIYGNRWAVVARGAGRRLPLEAPRLLARDLADLVRALGAGEPSRAAGIVGGWARALALLPRFARSGAPWTPFAHRPAAR
ncbi:MAG: glycosyltransferase family 2 protein [Holophagales bacterium]|nr:glycosyltransferase family 2 protein [Holophagales bacterium]